MSFFPGESAAPHNPLPGHLAKYRTPLHVFHEEAALHDAAELEKGLKSGLPGGCVELYYSVKTNPLLPLLRALVQRGWGMEVVGPDNFGAALEAGCPAERMLMNGAAWEREALEEAIFGQNVTKFTVDSSSMAALLARVWKSQKGAPPLSVSIRLHDGESHFGVAALREPLLQVLEQLPREMLREIGFQIHRNPHGSVETLDQMREDFAARASKIGAALAQLEGTPWPALTGFFDFGGGFDSPYVFRPHPAELGAFHDPSRAAAFRDRHAAKRFELEAAGRAVAETIHHRLGKLLEKRRVFFEPGRAVCTRALSTVLSVRAVKHHHYPDAQVVLTDGSTAFLGPLHRGVHPLSPKGPQNTFVYGCLPHSGDWLFQNVGLPQLKEGDRIVIGHTGAYFLALEARFGHELPAIVRDDRDERVR